MPLCFPAIVCKTSDTKVETIQLISYSTPGQKGYGNHESIIVSLTIQLTTTQSHARTYPALKIEIDSETRKFLQAGCDDKNSGRLSQTCRAMLLLADGQTYSHTSKQVGPGKRI
jgi:hypothetical protein